MAVPIPPNRCIYLDEDGAVFSISAFIRLNGLPDDQRLRDVIIEEVRAMFPHIRILEELN